MAKVLELPKLSPTMEEGQISAWHKKEGDAIDIDDLLAEVETDKATMEYKSFDRGTLLKILVPAGSVVQLGQPVAIIGAPGEDVSALAGGSGGAAAAKPSAAEAQPKGERAAPPAGGDAPVTSPPPAARGEAVSPPTQPAAPQPSSNGRVKASPYVRKLGRERGLDLSSVAGSGPRGRIVARDLEGLKPAPAAAAAKATAPGELAAPEVRPLSMMRKAIARRLTESKQTVPHFYLSIDVDADPLNALREQINADLAATAAEGEKPAKVSFNDLLVKACAIALVRVPECNAQFTPDAILVHQRVDISVAVAVPEGLVTPVVRDVDRKQVLDIAAEVRELAGRAKAKKLRPEEMANGTFSISNLGMYGIDNFGAVINPPEGAILAVGQVRQEPVVRGEQIVPGRRLSMTLSCDHRVVDGAVGATFLKVLRQLLEHPTQILLG
ncbi:MULTISPECIES: pyruvate dehydrogenase complex dihydrolipoamide acetyltransferase [Sorangium]|uniref:Acetyltransferase component of pyruvate dehydrogenase complex n=1 Tax=Sorangium atrum TaxID=2995308 RepID=A0ABT5C7U4_9BACT|nr:pyruvate dehydrogenase complex dihydrolipoamide acetyltransferase [Sorangium aterium]MDC0682038.1 pyruvate dehydrogenase complex dihydrolipoamide acetyltransferase [Sorangium aterium]